MFLYKDAKIEANICDSLYLQNLLLEKWRKVYLHHLFYIDVNIDIFRYVNR